MCGITGFWSSGSDSAGRAALDAMTDALAHRGPNDRGVWFDDSAGVGLGHRRLSIVDLSPLGHQPMQSASGRHVIVLNGEIYNYRALAVELEGLGHRFNGRSDTEVLLAAIDQWGVEEALRRSNGMFALAVWDRETRRLHLARDRIGKKPLFYGWGERTFLFGSELKSLLAFPQLTPRVDPGALSLFLRHDYVPAPWSILQGVYKLQPGALLSLTAADIAQPGGFSPLTKPQRYWDARAVLQARAEQPLRVEPAEALRQLDALLRDAVALRMHADVPLGAFLSGGTDSSTIVALMQAQSTRPVRTFSIGFHHASGDEAPQARAVANHLKTEHTELYVTGDDALALVPQLPELFDEPFADSSQIPMCLLARLARQSVTVALSGDGGDELFCGYNRYQRALRLRHWLQRVPRPVRRGLAGVIGPFAPREARTSRLATAVSELEAADSIAATYLNRVSRWRAPAAVVRDGAEHPTAFTDPAQQLRAAPDALAMMFLDLTTYLPEDILTKVDRATMAVALEGRAPLLDYRVVEFAFGLPLEMKLRDGEAKWLLKRLLQQYLPEPLVQLPKRGFGAPVSHWLKGPLREWAEAQLDGARLRREGHFDAERITSIWAEFQSGGRKLHTHVWNVLMFQAWLEWMNGETAKRPAP